MGAPPVIGPISPLIDILTHSLDVQRPLGLPGTNEDDSMPLFRYRRQTVASFVGDVSSIKVADMDLRLVLTDGGELDLDESVWKKGRVE